MTEKQGEWFCNKTGDIVNYGDECYTKKEKDGKYKCSECKYCVFMKF